MLSDEKPVSDGQLPHDPVDWQWYSALSYPTPSPVALPCSPPPCASESSGCEPRRGWSGTWGTRCRRQQSLQYLCLSYTRVASNSFTLFLRPWSQWSALCQYVVVCSTHTNQPVGLVSYWPVPLICWWHLVLYKSFLIHWLTDWVSEDRIV